jgi:hypothetical protein
MPDEVGCHRRGVASDVASIWPRKEWVSGRAFVASMLQRTMVQGSGPTF